MFKIYFFRFTQSAIDTLPKTHIKNINNHYVLSLKDKFFVMTSKQVNGLKDYFINIPNIENQMKPQYVIEHAHYFDAKYHIFEYTAKGAQYLIDHREKFQPALDALQQITQ